MTTADCRFSDVGGLLIAWCGALAVARVLPVSDSPRRKLAGMALGMALLILARLMTARLQPPVNRPSRARLA
jgi:hypothetical protein